MKRLLPFIVILLASCGDARTRQAEDALHQGNRDYRAGRFAGAREYYEQALHDPRVHHNAGKAAYRTNEWTVAAERLDNVRQMMDDPGQRSDALHDLGNTRLLEARWADSTAAAIMEQLAIPGAAADDIAGRLRMAVVRDSLRKERGRLMHLSDSALVQGVQAYRQAMKADPTDEDTRYNLVFAQGLLASREKERREQQENEKNDQELSEKARMLIAQADEMVEAYRFNDALELLQRGMQEDPTLAREKQYIDKLELVTRAAEAT